MALLQKILRDIVDAAADWGSAIGTSVVIRAKESKRARAHQIGKFTFRRSRASQEIISATGPSAKRLAGGEFVRVPPGGFKPPPGVKAWPIVKEGGIRFRSRIYIKYGGSFIRKRGYLQEALKREFVGIKRKTNMRRLAKELGVEIARGIANTIVERMLTHGIRAHVPLVVRIRRTF